MSRRDSETDAPGGGRRTDTLEQALVDLLATYERAPDPQLARTIDCFGQRSSLENGPPACRYLPHELILYRALTLTLRLRLQVVGKGLISVCNHPEPITENNVRLPVSKVS